MPLCGHAPGRSCLCLAPPRRLQQRIEFFPHPLFVLLGLEDLEESSHLVMPQSAQLGTGDFVTADAVGGEPQRNSHPRHRILLEPQFTDEEAVDDILGFEQEFNRPAAGNEDRRQDDIVLASRIGRVDAQDIDRVVDQVALDASEPAVGAWVTTRLDKLLPDDLDPQNIRRTVG